jgi:hypothetical protein
MPRTTFTASFANALAATALTGAVLIASATPSIAADQAPPPPYQMTGGHGVGIAVVWDEAAIRKALPQGIEPVKAMTGGINIYSVDRASGISAYSAAYFYVDIEGFDSPEGIKGRWMLAGVYGPNAKTSAALKGYSGFPVRTGTSHIDTTGEAKHAVGTLNGQDFVTADVKSVAGSCQPGTSLLNYVTLLPQAEQPVVTHIPFVGESCKAEAVSAKITAPPGDAFAAFTIAKVAGAGEFRNASFTFTTPQPAGK